MSMVEGNTKLCLSSGAHSIQGEVMEESESGKIKEGVVSGFITEVTSSMDFSNTASRRLPSLRGSIDGFRRNVSHTVMDMLSSRQNHDDDSWMFRPIEKAVLLFVQRKIFQNRPIYCELSKRDFESILLKEVGPHHISADFVDHLFAECDTENNGFIGVEQLTSYIHRIKPSTKWRARYYVASRLLTSFNVWGLVLFVSGSMMSTTNNLLSRQGQVSAMVLGIGMWLCLVGAFLWVVLALRKMRQEEADEKEALDDRETGTTQEAVETTHRIPLLPRIVWTDMRVSWINMVRNLLTVDQLIVQCWFFGCIAFLLAAYAHQLGMQESGESHVLGVGGILYLVGGLLSVPSTYIETLRFVATKETLKGDIYTLVLKNSPAYESSRSLISACKMFQEDYLPSRHRSVYSSEKEEGCETLPTDSENSENKSTDHSVLLWASRSGRSLASKEEQRALEDSVSYKKNRVQSSRKMPVDEEQASQGGRTDSSDANHSTTVSEPYHLHQTMTLTVVNDIESQIASPSEVGQSEVAKASNEKALPYDDRMMQVNGRQSQILRQSSERVLPVVLEDGEMETTRPRRKSLPRIPDFEYGRAEVPPFRFLSTQSGPMLTSNAAQKHAAHNQQMLRDGEQASHFTAVLESCADHQLLTSAEEYDLESQSGSPSDVVERDKTQMSSKDRLNLIDRCMQVDGRQSVLQRQPSERLIQVMEDQIHKSDENYEPRRPKLSILSRDSSQFSREQRQRLSKKRLSLTFVEILQFTDEETADIENPRAVDQGPSARRPSLRGYDSMSTIGSVVWPAGAYGCDTDTLVSDSKADNTSSPELLHNEDLSSSMPPMQDDDVPPVRRKMSRGLLERVLGKPSSCRSILGKEIVFASSSGGGNIVLERKSLAEIGCCHELYLALLDAGVELNLDAFIDVVINEFDKDSIGVMGKGAFARFASPNNNSRLLRHWTVIKKLPKTPSFWIAIIFIIAGALLTIAAYGLFGASPDECKNMFLGGSSTYMVCGAYCVLEAFQGARRKFARLESSRLKFKSKIFEHAREPRKRENNVAAVQINVV